MALTIAGGGDSGHVVREGSSGSRPAGGLGRRLLLGPRGGGAVQRLLPRELLGAALGRGRAQVRVDLLLGQALELLVVAEDPLALRRHAQPPWPEKDDEPGPLMTMNQKAKTAAQMIAVVAKTRPIAPWRWSM